jgi:hypothetical protein
MTEMYRIDGERLFLLHPFAKEILARLADAGHEAVLIGGVEKSWCISETWRGSG